MKIVKDIFKINAEIQERFDDLEREHGAYNNPDKGIDRGVFYPNYAAVRAMSIVILTWYAENHGKKYVKDRLKGVGLEIRAAKVFVNNEL